MVFLFWIPRWPIVCKLFNKPFFKACKYFHCLDIVSVLVNLCTLAQLDHLWEGGVNSFGLNKNTALLESKKKAGNGSTFKAAACWRSVLDRIDFLTFLRGSHKRPFGNAPFNVFTSREAARLCVGVGSSYEEFYFFCLGDIIYVGLLMFNVDIFELA